MSRRTIVALLPVTKPHAPVFGSTTVACAECGVTCWLAMSSRTALDDGAEARCVSCALAQIEHDGGGNILAPTPAQRAELAANRHGGRN